MYKSLSGHHHHHHHHHQRIWSGPSVLGGWCPASSWQRTVSPSISEQSMRRSSDTKQFWRHTFLLRDLEPGTICHRNCDTRISPLDNLKTCWNLTYLLAHQRMYQSRVYNVEEQLDIRCCLERGAVDSAIDGERVFAPT